MLLRMSRRVAILGIAFGAIVMSMATPAQAAFQIKLSEAGFGDFYIPAVPAPTGTGTLAFSGVYGDFFISVLGQTTNSPGAPDEGNLMGATATVQNLKAGTSTNTLTITASSNGFLMPVSTPLNFFSGASATFGVKGGSLSYQSYGDSANTLYTLSGTASYTPGPQGPLTASGPGTLSTGESHTYFTTGTPYSLSNVTSITLKQGATAGTVVTDLTTLDPTNPAGFLQKVAAGTGGAVLNYSNHTIVTPVPEPATMALVASGLPLLGLTWLRRRKAQA